MLITATELIRQTFQTYEHNFREISKYIALMLAAWVLLAANALFNFSYLLETLGQIPGLITIAITQFSILALFFLVTLTLTRVLKKMHHHETPDTIWNEIKAARKVFIPSLLTSFLLGGIVFLGCLLLLIPGIIFAIWFYFAPFAAIIDNQKPVAALKNSYHLVAGRFGLVLWNLVAPTAAYMFVFFLFNWMILTPGRYFLSNSGMIAGYWVSIGLMILFYFLFLPIITLTPIILYENLKDTKLPPAN